jgi:putative DNA primase/helicase
MGAEERVEEVSTELEERRSQFLNGDKKRFVPSKASHYLREATPTAVGGGEIYVYLDGCYRQDGEEQLRAALASVLGEHWRPSYADETVTHVRTVSPRLAGHPPLDRINLANGILLLDTCELVPHTPELLTPIQLPVAYEPDAECPEIERALTGILPDAAVRRVFYEVVGYLLTADNSLQRAFMFLGGGENGKSTLVRVITALLGEANVCAVPLHRLEEDRFAPAQLYGKLANVFADLDARALASSSIFKSITGGDLVQAERKFRDAFSFVPFARLIFSANEAPPTPDSSDAFFRRWLVIPFEERFTGRADHGLLEKLTTPEELSGLLNHGLAARPGLFGQGDFATTTPTALAKHKFRVDSDSVAGFVDECCDVDPTDDGMRESRSELYAGYRWWCSEAGRRPLSRQRFNHRVEEMRSTDLRKLTGEWTWYGIRLDDHTAHALTEERHAR